MIDVEIFSENHNLDLNIESEDKQLELDIASGGSSTNHYDKLLNLPKINDVELIGNKSSSELKLQGEMEALSNMDIENLLKGGI